MEIEKLIIIGSGPAGLSAAIYAARGNLNPLVVTGRVAGGQLMLTTDVDDFPGFPEGIRGPDLIGRMRKQAERFMTRFLDEDVVEVDFKRLPFIVKTESRKFEAQAVIVATGASAKWLGLPSEQKLVGRGVSACAVCDGPFFKGKVVAIVGGGDTAMREAGYLSKLCKKVIVIHRRDALRAQAVLQSLVKTKQNVNFIFNSQVVEVLGKEKVSGVKLKNTKTGNVVSLDIDGLFVAIGHQPNTGFLKGRIELDTHGYIVAHGETKTSVAGIFFAGDVADKKYKQAGTAVGMGVKAALDAEEYLEMLKLPTENGA